MSDVDARTWVAALPDELTRQRILLQGLLDVMEGDPRWCRLEFGCSVAEGRGDALSDLDLALGVAKEVWPEALDDLARLLTSLGEVVDSLRHRISGMGDRPHQRIFVQYVNGVQLDLVAVPAHLPKGTQPENIVLYDPDRLRVERWDASVLQAAAAMVREWAFLGWTALGDLAKYLRRGSLWEALERLHEARAQVWRLWAVSQGLQYPIHGVTTVLDHPEIGLPPGIEATVAGLDRAGLLRAAVVCADLLEGVAASAALTVGSDIPIAMGRFVRQQLANGGTARKRGDVSECDR